MDFWQKNNYELLGIESDKIFSAKYLQPDYRQEQEANPSELKKLRQAWIKVLPSLEQLEHLKITTLINQEYFEAICQIPNLKSLYIHNARTSNFLPIAQLTKLEQLDFSANKSITTLNGIQNLSALKELSLDCFFGIYNIDELAGLSKLEVLKLFAGVDGKKLNIESVEPISHLKGLTTLALDIKEKLNINCFDKLTKLQKLFIPDSYHQKARQILPNLSILR